MLFSACAAMAMSGLLTSWATPASSSPAAAKRPCSSARSRSTRVISLKCCASLASSSLPRTGTPVVRSPSATRASPASSSARGRDEETNAVEGAWSRTGARWDELSHERRRMAQPAVAARQVVLQDHEGGRSLAERQRRGACAHEEVEGQDPCIDPRRERHQQQSRAEAHDALHDLRTGCAQPAILGLYRTGAPRRESGNNITRRRFTHRSHVTRRRAGASSRPGADWGHLERLAPWQPIPETG